MLVAVCATLTGLVACTEQTPTSLNDQEIPGEPITLEIRLPWSEFGSDLQVFGGYGAPSSLGEGIVAKTYGDSLEARTLLRFTAYPQSVQVRDPGGTLHNDFNFVIRQGYVVAVFDTRASTNEGPVTLALGALQESWDPRTATWDLAVDSIGEQRPWPEPGAGPVTTVSTATWDPSSGDSVVFAVDSAQLAAWGEAEDSTRGARIELLTDGERLHLSGGALRLEATTSFNADTVLVLPIQAQVTFVYDPPATPPSDGLRVGGTPAWRSTLGVAVPTELDGPPELCAEVGCPFSLEPKHVSYASLNLTSRATAVAYQPTDSMGFDVRAVLSPPSLPKSPLSASLAPTAAGFRVEGDVFGPAAGQVVEIPITPYVKSFLAGPDPSGRPPPGTLALLSASEPSTFWYASFYGPGGATEPVLKLVLTVSRPMELQ